MKSENERGKEIALQHHLRGAGGGKIWTWFQNGRKNCKSHCSDSSQLFRELQFTVICVVESKSPVLEAHIKPLKIFLKQNWNNESCTSWILPLTVINGRLFCLFGFFKKNPNLKQSGDNREIMHDFSHNGILTAMECTSCMFPSIQQIIFCVT